MNIPSLNKHKQKLGLIVLIIFFIIFAFYITKNPSIIDSIRQASAMSVVVIFLIYAVFLLSNFLLIRVSVAPFGLNLKNLETFFVAVYSTLVNFFGPLQSGPGYRTVYFKSKHQIKIKDYAKITFLYYIIFMSLSAVMLFAGSKFVFPIILSVLLAAFFVYKKGLFLGYTLGIFYQICLLAFFQLVLGVVLFYSELLLIGANPNILSVVSYTGAANIAILVGITPGAIGIREGFLILSQSLHGIPSEQIIAANVLDRSVYFIFLFSLFIISSSLHIKQRLSHSKPD